MSKEKSSYHSYLLRFWQISDPQQRDWRASLLDVQSGHRWGFANLDNLCHFLRKHLREPYSSGRSNQSTSLTSQKDDEVESPM